MKYQIVGYKPAYAPAISKIVTRNLLEINSKDYPPEDMKKLAYDFTANKIDELSKIRKFFVALNNDLPIGIASAARDRYGNIGDYVILTVFVLPEQQGKGIGKELIKKCERYIKKVNGRKITIPASITSYRFYNNLGYDYKNADQKPNDVGHIMMVKKLDR